MDNQILLKELRIVKEEIIESNRDYEKRMAVVWDRLGLIIKEVREDGVKQ
jgi:hypothetical protein